MIIVAAVEAAAPAAEVLVFVLVLALTGVVDAADSDDIVVVLVQ